MIELASFDLEILGDFEEGITGITCMGIALDPPHPTFGDYLEYSGIPVISDFDKFFDDAQTLLNDGYLFLTWNGTKFDFDVLANESSQTELCKDIVMNYHIDMMALFAWSSRHMLSLQAALKGSVGASKLKTVTLSDGTELTGMSGAKAPELWEAGEYSAVLEYLKQDCTEPIKLARHIEQTGRIDWYTKNGKYKQNAVYPLLTMSELIKKDMSPAPSWVSEPITPDFFFSNYAPIGDN